MIQYPALDSRSKMDGSLPEKRHEYAPMAHFSSKRRRGKSVCNTVVQDSYGMIALASDMLQM